MTDLRRAHRTLLAVCATLTLLAALFVPLSLPLGWDEIVYATRFPPFARGLDVPFEAPRTRGVPALIAPVALWSDSVVLLRAWLSLVSGAALYAGFLPWLRALPDRPTVVPLAAAAYGTLWSVLFYAGSAMPNHTTAMGATAAVGCFVRYGGGRPVRDGGGGSVADGGESVACGDGEPVPHGDGEPVPDGRGASVRSARGKSIQHGDGRAARYGGESVPYRDGEPVPHGDGKSARHGDGEPVPDERGTSARSTGGKSIQHGDGRSALHGRGESVPDTGGRTSQYSGGGSVPYGDGEPVPHRIGERRGALLCGIALGLAVATSMRPNDAVWIAVPLLLAPLAYRPWRAFAPAVAVVAGVAAGLLPWAVESVLRYGGIAERLALANGQQGGMRPQFALPYLITALDGPLLCRPCAGDGIALPVALWWFALPVLVGAGLWLVRREAPQLRAALRLATVVAVSSALTYAFLVDYTAPRFLFTAYALLILPAAVALRALLQTVRRRGRAAVAVLAVVLCGHLAVQLGTLAVHADVQAEARRDWFRIRDALRAAGVGPGCVLDGNSSVVPIAYTARCHPAAQYPGRAPDALVLRRTGPPPRLGHWQVLAVPDSYNGWRIAVPPPAAPAGPDIDR